MGVPYRSLLIIVEVYQSLPNGHLNWLSSDFPSLFLSLSSDASYYISSLLVARIESRDPENFGISSNMKVSRPRPTPPEIFPPVPRARNPSLGTIRTLLPATKSIATRAVRVLGTSEPGHTRFE